jgi:hypothetical protein
LYYGTELIGLETCCDTIKMVGLNIWPQVRPERVATRCRFIQQDLQLAYNDAVAELPDNRFRRGRGRIYLVLGRAGEGRILWIRGRVPVISRIHDSE